jgi:hypothetical protein
MSRQVLRVVPTSSGWFVECEQSSQGPYHSDDLALRVALIEAMQRRRNGAHSTVALQGREGLIKAEYCI